MYIDIVTRYGEISSAKMYWGKSKATAVGKWSSGLPQLPGGFIWKRGGLKYLSVYLGDEKTVQKNWDGVVEKVEGKLCRWRWLLPHMSYRGRALIINNLAASTLWHRLKCMELVQKVQAIMIEFCTGSHDACFTYQRKREGRV